MDKYFWHLSTAFFVILWFVIVPYIGSIRHDDLTAPVSVGVFSDSAGLVRATNSAASACRKFVYTVGVKVAAANIELPKGAPGVLYNRCMVALDATI